ncbi:hypothetical protein SDJN03_07202, partial [Cucurbita argyrosperma subsp. sororia]
MDITFEHCFKDTSWSYLCRIYSSAQDLLVYTTLSRLQEGYDITQGRVEVGTNKHRVIEHFRRKFGCACPHGRPSWPREGLGLWALALLDRTSRWVDRVRVVGLLVRNWVEDLWALSWAETRMGFAPGRLWACGLVCPGILDRFTRRVRVDPTLWLWTSFSLQKLQILIPPSGSSTTVVLR